MAAAQTAGRRAVGASAFLRQAAAGQTANEPRATVATRVWAGDEPAPTVNG